MYVCTPFAMGHKIEVYIYNFDKSYNDKFVMQNLTVYTRSLDHLRTPLKVLISIRVPLDIQSINQSIQMYFPNIIIQVTWVYLHDILLKVYKV